MADENRKAAGARLGRRDGGGLRGARAAPLFSAAASAGLTDVVAAGAGAYDRTRALPRLIAIDPRELRHDDDDLRRLVLSRLARALRAERRRGRAGHWTYDLNRHIALMQAIAAEGERSGRRPCRPASAAHEKTPPGGPDGV